MKKILLIIAITSILVSCNKTDTVVLSQEEYKQLKGDTIKPKYPKPFELYTEGLGGFDIGIILGSDKHEYLLNDFNSSSGTTEHYVDCELCLTRKQQEKEELYRLISSLKDSIK